MAPVTSQVAMIISGTAAIIAAQAMRSSDSLISAIERAASVYRAAWVVYLITLFLVALSSLWLWKAGDRVQDAVRAEADARIALAGKEAADANKIAAGAGEGTAKALAEVAAAKVREAALTLKVEEQRGKAAKALESAAAVNERAGKLELEAAAQRERAANAERQLEELRQRVADRHLTAEQRAAIRAVLVKGGPPNGKISVTCFGPDPEPCRFAAEIVDVLRTSGWLVDFGANSQFLPVGSVARGVFVRTQNPDIHRAAVLQSALEAAGIPCPGEVRGDAAEGWVDLLVAFKP